ncbi:MAG: hypothetical protein ACXVGD_22580, partial [Blastococcus sp.]
DAAFGPYRTAEQPLTRDLLSRDFTADRPRHKLVGDITYVRTWEGWLYLTSVFHSGLIDHGPACAPRRERCP